MNNTATNNTATNNTATNDMVTNDMVTNPYESPPHVPGDMLAASVATRQLRARAVFGLWAGVLFGGSFGAGGSVMLGLASSALFGWDVLRVQSFEHFLLTEIVAAIAGAICGLVCGSLIGPIVAMVSSLSAACCRWPALLSSVLLSAMAGGAIGFLGGRVLSAPGLLNWSAVYTGVTLGVLFGALGGYILGRGVLDFAVDES